MFSQHSVGQPMFAAQQGTGLRVTKLLLQETGTYNQQWRRPYHTVATGRELEMFAERLNQMPVITAPALAGVAGQFIEPFALPERPADIVNNWGERRLRFMMEVVYSDMHGNVNREIVLGYTDHPGVIVHPTRAHLDENMVFYINSVVKVREVNRRTPLGLEQYTKVTDSSHLLYNENWGGVLSPTQEHRMRPQDVLTSMTTTHIADPSDLLDSRIVQGNSATFSRRTNGMPTEYVASVLQSYKAALGDEKYGQGEMEILSAARGYAAEESVTQDYFVAAIAKVQNRTPSNNFTYRDLLKLYPGTPEVLAVGMVGPTERRTLHESGLTQDWHAPERETVIATMLSHAVPAMMMEFGITRLGFTSTNHNVGSAVTTVIADVISFSNIDLSPVLPTFIQRLESTVLADISVNNQIGFFLQMRVDLLGETWTKIAWGSNPEVDYVTPSFSDALMVPVLTQNKDVSLQIAKDFEDVTNVLSNSRGPSFPSAMGHQRPSF